MTKIESIEWAGSPAKLAKILGVTASAVCQWGTYPPLLQQYRISAMSGNTLPVTPKPERKARPVKGAA